MPKLFSLFDRLAFWWLRKRYPKGSVIMRSRGEQELLANYDKLAGPERS